MKYKPSITDSPAHFYNQIRRQAQYFSGDLLKVLQKNLQTNSSSAHPENILVGMVACDDPVRREGAVMMILKIRDLPTIGGIREYILPKLFFKSSSFKSMIKFHNETGIRPTYTAWNGKKLPVTEPPLLMPMMRPIIRNSRPRLIVVQYKHYALRYIYKYWFLLQFKIIVQNVDHC